MNHTRLRLSTHEQSLLAGDAGDATQLAMRIVVRMGEILGARELVEITSSHIDGCLYHGDGGVEFAERLVRMGGAVAVPATLNVGAAGIGQLTALDGCPATLRDGKLCVDRPTQGNV